MASLQTGPHHFVDVYPGTNAELLLRWCAGDSGKAAVAAQFTPHRFVFWHCDANPPKLAEILRQTNLHHIIPSDP